MILEFLFSSREKSGNFVHSKSWEPCMTRSLTSFSPVWALGRTSTTWLRPCISQHQTIWLLLYVILCLVTLTTWLWPYIDRHQTIWLLPFFGLNLVTSRVHSPGTKPWSLVPSHWLVRFRRWSAVTGFLPGDINGHIMTGPVNGHWQVWSNHRVPSQAPVTGYYLVTSLIL